jgi:hypothetical protein
MSTRSNIYIKPDVWLRFRVACLQTGTTASKEIMRLIEARLEEIEPQIEAAKQKGAAVVVKKPATRPKDGAREVRG